MSFDGVMQAPGGPEEDPTVGFKHGGWVAGYFDDFLGKVMVEQMSKPFDLLLGRRTYEIFAAHCASSKAFRLNVGFLTELKQPFGRPIGKGE